jgi:HlyD family secretion protein
VRPRRAILLVVLIGAVVALTWALSKRTHPVDTPFTKVARETVVSTLNTNGKVEPLEWASARAERAGVVKRVYVQRGQNVRAGAPLVALDVREAASQLATAQAQIQEAQAQEQVVNQGGRNVERTQIEGELAAARLELQAAQKDVATLERLVAKQAATRQELDTARQRVDRAETQIRSLDQRRAALVGATDKQIADARVKQAEASAALARSNLSLSTVSAPVAGTVYQFDLKIGSFVNAGDLVANIGKLDKVRVIVYVDEPDLGRVVKGEPVVITWDAMPNRQWKGAVDKLPTQVIPLGSRQVGEVSCVIENPDRDLLPGTNINAEIQSKVVTDALTIPKEALRREGGKTGVYVLTPDDRVAWRNVKIGVSSYTKTQALSGVAEGDSVLLPTDKPIKDGARVNPVYP